MAKDTRTTRKVRDYLYKNIRIVLGVTTAIAITLYVVLINIAPTLDELWLFFRVSWPFLVIHIALFVASIMLAIREKERRISLWLVSITNLIEICIVGFFFILGVR